MTPIPPSTQATGRRFALPLLLVYPVLAITGALTQRQVFSLLALAVLWSALLLPRLFPWRILPCLSWMAGLLVLWLVSRYGFADVVLEMVPVLINALLAWWFGRTLATTRPRVARFIVAIEGEARLHQRGVADYARQLTRFWAWLLGAQAVLLTLLLLLAEHGGLLARLGIVAPIRVPDSWAAAWLHLGGYMLLGVVFVLEYGYRRWRLRHLSHPGLYRTLLQLARQWPQLLRGNGTTS